MALASGRLAILTAQEIEELYGLPRFSEEDRRRFFDVSPAERALVDAVQTTAAAVQLTLQLGYFKASRRFFVYTREAVLPDLAHICRRSFPHQDPDAILVLSKPTRLAQQQVILDLFDYRLCDGAAKAALELRLQRAAMLSTQPVFILREALTYLTNQRLVAPGYTYLQDLVGRVVAGERCRITRLLERALTPPIEQSLDSLLQADEGMYRISVLKHEPKDFSYGELRQEVARRTFFAPLYAFGQAFLAASGLSNESVKYYASLVQFYTVYKLQRTAPMTTRLYLLCFAYHRFRQINDHLVDAFIHLIDQYEQQAKSAAALAAQQAAVEASANLSAVGHVLQLFVDESIPDSTPFLTVRQKAFSPLKPERIPVVSAHLRAVAFDTIASEWSHYGTLHHTFKRNLRHLFCALDFAALVEDEPLLEAVAFLQDLLRGGKSPRQATPAAFPTGVIAKSVQRYLYTQGTTPKDKRLDVDRYEFLVYRLLRNGLEAGNVYVQDSNEFRSFEDDLINNERWQAKDAVLREIGAPLLLAPIQETLAAFHAELEAGFTRVNDRIANGENTHIKVTGTGDKRRWTLIYPTEEEPTNSPFYGQLPSIGIVDVLWFVAGRTNFLGAFPHVLDRYVKQDADPCLILACIVAMGTNLGLWKMAEVSGISFSALQTTARNFLRAETLHAGNDVIADATAALPQFTAYDIDGKTHSSSDGQRIETQTPTINARHSRKYFALKKGVSAYTLVANHVPVNARIIGTHEHESHYVFDILHHNTTDVHPERYSTDTHGTNQMNFFLLHVFGYQFAPRYRDLHKKMDGLVGVHHPSHYAGSLIKPARKTFDALIVKEWPNIQRILASLAQKDVTQATVVRKLSSYARQNQTKKALWGPLGVGRDPSNDPHTGLH
jgi:TnpA family transposase